MSPGHKASEAGRGFGGAGKRVGMAAVFNLNHPANTVHWHFFSMSVANVVAIIVMLLVFAIAILAPFPGQRGHKR